MVAGKDIIFQVSLPLSVKVSKRKTFILNLNNFRNLHYRLLNNAKQGYTDLVMAIVPRIKLPHEQKIILVYVYYAPSKRKCDVANICSIVDKFTCDGLVKAGVIKDDNTDYVAEVRYIWGGVDRDNPRCDLFVCKAS